MENRIIFLGSDGKYCLRFLSPEKRDDRELVWQTFARIKEKYGLYSTAYSSIIRGIDKRTLRGSQFLFELELESNLQKGQRIPRLKDWKDAFLYMGRGQMIGVYSSTPQIILNYPEDEFKKNFYLTRDLARKVASLGYEISPNNPAIITGAKIEKLSSANDSYGISLNINGAQIENDRRFSEEHEDINMGITKKILFTGSHGLRGIDIFGQRYIAEKSDLSYSNERGRIAVIEKIGELPYSSGKLDWNPLCS
jgi:hypothetical protein